MIQVYLGLGGFSRTRREVVLKTVCYENAPTSDCANMVKVSCLGARDGELTDERLG